MSARRRLAPYPHRSSPTDETPTGRVVHVPGWDLRGGDDLLGSASTLTVVDAVPSPRDPSRVRVTFASGGQVDVPGHRIFEVWR